MAESETGQNPVSHREPSDPDSQGRELAEAPESLPPPEPETLRRSQRARRTSLRKSYADSCCLVTSVTMTVDGLTFYYAFLVISIFTCLFGCVGNMYIIWLLRFRMEKTTFRTYIVNLAMADLGTVIFLPVALILHSFHRLSYVLPHAVFFAMCTASLCFLVAVSVNRCVSVLCPRWYRCCQPKCLLTRLAFSIWTLVGLFCSMEVSFYVVYSVSLSHTFGVMFTMNFWILPSLLAVCTAVLLIGLRYRYRGHPPGSPTNVVISMLLFFLVFGGPCVVINSLEIQRVSLSAFEYTHLFFAINSSIKPIFYSLEGSQWMCHSTEPLIIALQRVFQDKGNATAGRDLMGLNLTAKETRGAQVV
ncbi:UNVERIFIED_CONTAM: hypothetical protein K2H54_013250 [Gekko kuhli]